jgi:hypothetical protein
VAETSGDHHAGVPAQPKGQTTMTSFSSMGEAMMLAVEGQQQIVRAFLLALGRGLTNLAH